MSNINFDSANFSEFNEVFVPQTIESEGISEGKEVHKLIVTPEQFTKETMYQTFNIPEWIKDGFTYNDQVSLYVPTKELSCSHMVTVSHIMRFNSEFNRVVPGTSQMYYAQNINHDKGKYTEYDKQFPMGNPDKKTEMVGRGLVAGFDKDGLLDYDNVLLSKYFSYAEEDNTLRDALDDVFSNTLEGVGHAYSKKHLDIAAGYKATGTLTHVSKVDRKEIIKATKRGEIAVNSVFSFNWEEYGIESREDVRIANIHNANRNKFTQYLGGLAKASGVQVGQYAQFTVMGFAYSANTLTPKLEDKYESKATFVRYHHNVATGLPMGIVVLCKPVKYVQLGSSGSVGTANSKSRLLKGLGKRPVTTTPVITTGRLPMVNTQLPFVLPEAYVTPEVTEAPKMSLSNFGSLTSLTPISAEEFGSNEVTLED